MFRYKKHYLYLTKKQGLRNKTEIEREREKYVHVL